MTQYSCGVQVQRGAVTQTAATTDVPITPVASTNRAFLSWSKTVDPTEQDWGPADQTAGSLTATNNIRFESNTAQGGSSGSEVSWYDATWLYRKVLTIDHTKVTGTHTNFPVLVSITDPDLASYAQADSDDILFTSSDGTTKLSHEIETFNSGTGQLVAWVKLPTLPSSTDTALYLYYGNASVSSQQAATATWPSQYRSVWHLKEDPTGTAPQFKDSTANANHGTNQGAMPVGSQVAGKVNGSITLDGGNDYISTANQQTNPQNFAIGGWFKTTTASGKKIIGFETAQTGTSTSAYDRQMYVGTDGKLRFGVNSVNGNDLIISTGTVTDGNWHHAVGYLDQAGATLGLYLDGVLQGTKSSPNAEAYNGYWRIGSYWAPEPFWPLGVNGYFPGSVDEFRVTDTVPTAGWISTQYNNQNSPSTFMTLGSAESQSTAPWYSSSWQYRKVLTVDKTKVAGSLTDFPVLVSITATDLATYAQSDADDIMFTSSDGTTKLSHEIESYNSGTGALVAWVKVPSLTSAANTRLHMYYGNASVASQQNATAVWDANVKTVLHLKENPTGTAPQFKDSSSNTNHGTAQGTMLAGAQVSGKINGSLTLDGTDDYVSTTNQLSNPQNFMESVWFKTTTASGKKVLGFEQVQVGTGAGSYDRHIYVGTDGKVYFGVNDGAGTNVAIASTGTVTDGLWHQAVGYRDDASDTIGLYLDGTLQTTTASTQAQPYDGYLRIGAYRSLGPNWPQAGGHGYFPGSVDEVRFHDIVRSSAFISTQWNNQNSPSTFLSVGAAQTQSNWYSSSWQYRKPVTIDKTKVGAGTHTNFPVLVGRTDFGLVGRTQSQGQDILFTLADGVTKLDHQIEYYNSATGQMYIWVRMPTLTNVANTTIYMYYGNPGASSQQNAAGVWGSDHYGVWHLNETVNTNTGGFQDSSSAANHATYRGTSGATNNSDFSLALDGTDDYLSTTNQHTGSGPQVVTVEAWAKTSSASGKPIVSLDGGQTGTASGLWDRQLYIGTDGRARFMIYNAAYAVAVSTNSTYADGNWHHLTGTYSNVSQTVTLYVDGVAQTPVTGVTSAESDPGWWRIGSYHASSSVAGANGYFPGSIDEVRVASVVRSAGWIQTDFNEQNNPSVFTILGSEQTRVVQPHTIWWQVVEFTNAADINVQRGTTSLTGTTLSTPVTLATAVDLSRTFVTAEFTSSGVGADIGARMIRARLTGTTTLTIDRSVYGTPDSIELITWQVVELKDGSRVQSGSASFANGAPTATPTLTAVDTSRATAFASVRMASGLAAGRSDYVGDDNLGVASATVTVTSATQLTLTRANLSGAADIAWFVVEWGGPTWWNANYAQRHVITVTTTTAASPADYTQSVTFDHAAMVSAGTAQADGDDVRVLYWNGSTWTELDRVLDDYSSWNSTTTQLWFKLPTAIGASSSDGSYFLYHANPSAASPPVTKSNVYVYADGFESGLTNWNAWYDNNWQYRKKITLTAAQISGTNTDFPVLISATDSALITKAQTDADDILFTAGDGVTKLKHEVEKYTSGTGQIIAWVKMPTLSSTSNELYMYYGNASASAQSDPANVWTNGFAGVYHLKENPTNPGTNEIKDSTANGYHGSSSGSMTSSNQVAGNIDGSVSFDGTDDKIPTADYADGASVSQLSISAWVSPAVAKNQRLIAKSTTASNTVANDWSWALGIDATNIKASVGTASNGGIPIELTLASAVPLTPTWTYITMTYDGSTIRAYKNGAVLGSAVQTGTVTDITPRVTLGNYDGTTDRYLNGRLDEARVATTARSAGWFLTEYNNQSNPAGFHTFASEETPGSGTVYTVASDQVHSGANALKVLPTAVAGNLLTAKNVSLADVEFDAFWRLSSTSSFDVAQSVRAGISAPSNGYLGSLSSTGFLRTGKDINGTYSTFATASSNTCPGAGGWAKVSVKIVGTTLNVVCRTPSLALAVGPSSTGAELTSGTVGFRTSAVPAGQNLWVDDVTVRKLISPEPAATVGAADRP
ncbi:hypothetical protein Lesp02_23130 [Lentzea sp. NBRC 105346]|nr:hypothetical protein Lesp02_23130 [Lentzea sp. NBRC 105346]